MSQTNKPRSQSPAKSGGSVMTVVGALLGAAAGAALLGSMTWTGGCGDKQDASELSADQPQAGSTSTAQNDAAPLASLPAPPEPPDDTNAPEAAEPEPPEPPKVDLPYAGPWLAALAQSTPIYPTARFSRNRMGYIRRGGKVPVIDKPIKTASCKQGFYPLVDGGYVCGKYATTNLADARVKAGIKAPDIEALLPYRYAYNKAHGTPLYSRVPSRADMLRYEPYLDKKRRDDERKKAEKEEKAKQADMTKAAKAKAAAVAKAAAQAKAEANADASSSASPSAKPPSSGDSGSKLPAAKAGASSEPNSNPSSASAKAADSAGAVATANPSAAVADKHAQDAAIADADKPRSDKGAGGGSGDDPPDRPWWQHDGDGPPKVKLSDLEESDGALSKRMVKGFFIAVDRTFGANDRLWYQTTEGLIAPTDRMIIPKTPELKGIELGGDVKQAGFIRWQKGHKYVADGDGFKRGDPLKRFLAVGLTGKTKVVKKERYRETVDGWWMQERQGTFTEPGKRPEEVGSDEKWVDVNLSRKTLVALVGDTPVYAAIVSPGKRSASKRSDHRTKVGKWRVREKHVTTTMDGDGPAGDLPYSIQDVPYVQYYDGSYALHGAFWHHNFGNEQSHGCVNLAPLDAKHMFFWTEPQLPRGWHGVWSSDKRKGTMVVVHE